MTVWLPLVAALAVVVASDEFGLSDGLQYGFAFLVYGAVRLFCEVAL